MGTGNWSTEDKKRVKEMVEVTERILSEARRLDSEPVILAVNFQTGSYKRFDSSNMDSFVPKQISSLFTTEGEAA